MKTYVVRPALACLLIGALAAAYAPSISWAADADAKTSVSKTKKKAAATTHRTTVKFLPGSGETPGQRSARLKRECKGAVNAGACEGYTR